MSDATHYLLELRSRILQCLIVTGVVFSALSLFANDLYHVLAMPLLKSLPKGHGLIATKMTATVLVPFKFAFVVSLFIAIPYILFHMWSFISPALYVREKKIVWLLLFPSTVLFYAGVLFAYYVVLPLMFNFFVKMTPADVELRPDISQYLDFTLQLFLAFGFAFEVPIITVAIVQFRWVTIDQLRKARPYVIVLAFIVGMFLTPPDVISQTLVSIPLWLLYELGIGLAKIFK